MRTLTIDTQRRVAETDHDLDDWTVDEIEWDTTQIDEGHDVWFDDEGLTKPGAVVAKIAGIHVPLPAVVAGFQGERTTDATMSVGELEAMIG